MVTRVENGSCNEKKMVHLFRLFALPFLEHCKKSQPELTIHFSPLSIILFFSTRLPRARFIPSGYKSLENPQVLKFAWNIFLFIDMCWPLGTLIPGLLSLSLTLFYLSLDHGPHAIALTVQLLPLLLSMSPECHSFPSSLLLNWKTWRDERQWDQNVLERMRERGQWKSSRELESNLNQIWLLFSLTIFSHWWANIQQTPFYCFPSINDDRENTH